MVILFFPSFPEIKRMNSCIFQCCGDAIDETGLQVEIQRESSSRILIYNLHSQRLCCFRLSREEDEPVRQYVGRDGRRRQRID